MRAFTPFAKDIKRRPAVLVIYEPKEWNVNPGRRPFAALLASVAAFVAGHADAQTLSVTQEADKEKTIRVVSQGKFETTFTLRKGFGASWFDLAHDPEKKRDLAPVLDENGLYWVKMARTPPDPKITDTGSWYANPAQRIELLERGPVRAKVRLTGQHMRYGRTDERAAMKELAFELTHTVYPTGAVYTSYVLDAAEEIPLHHFVTIIKSNGAWGPAGKGEGKGEAHCVTEGGDDAPRGIKAPASFVLQWSNGPTFFADMLLVYYTGRYGTSYWNEGFQDKDYRAGMNIMSRFQEKRLPKGKTAIPFLFRISDDMNSAATAASYANDYRSPDKLEVSKGTVDTADEGDLDRDGYNESEGCYVLRAGADGVAFTIHGKQTPRMKPAFKIKGWPGDSVPAVTINARRCEPNKDYVASVKGGVALVLLWADVRDDTVVQLSGT
ncbi:MAG: hypothetical protein FJ290_28600 [Planctomycetes bacterium]|nr:hypothetical protein [Planctomycetota bacterium]